jgi:hypothetical protein
VTQSGDRIRLDVTMVRPATGEQFARTRIESTRTEIFALQDALADTVAAFLRARIGSELGARQLRQSTRSVAAWERLQTAEREATNAAALVRANDLDNAKESILRADSLLGLAEAADPAWTEPIVRRGWLAYRRSRLGGMQRNEYEEWIAVGLNHAARALAREPDHASALELRGTLTYWMVLLNLVNHDLTEDVAHTAESDLRAAIAAGGSNASAYSTLSHLLLNKGEVAEAKLNAVQAYERDAFLENTNLTLWRIFSASWALQDDVEARRYCGEGSRRFPDDFRFRQCELMLYALPGAKPDIQRAWTLLDDFTHLSPPQVRDVNHERGKAYLALALIRGSLPDSARAVLRTVAADASIDPVREVALTSSIGFTWLGDIVDAVDRLEIYLSANPGLLEAYRAQANRRALPWYHQSLLDEPGFRALIGAH